MRGLRLAQVACAGFVALSLSACGQKPHAIEADPAAVKLMSTTDKVTLKTKVVDEAGKPIADAKVAFASSDDKIAAVSATGEVTGKKSGKANITASVGEVKKQIPVDVKLYTSIKLTPETWDAKVGDLGALKAEVLDEAGNPIADAAVTWTSSDENIAKVDPTGNVTAGAAGEAKITAKSQKLEGSATVKIAPAGPASLNAASTTFDLAVAATGKFEVTGADAAGAPVAGLVLTFSTSDDKIATVGPDGTITGVAAGTATITATEPAGKSITATVNVK